METFSLALKAYLTQNLHYEVTKIADYHICFESAESRNWDLRSPSVLKA